MVGSGLGTSESFTRVAMVARALTGRLQIGEIVEIVVNQGMAGLDSGGAVFAELRSPGIIVPTGWVGYPAAAVTAMGTMSIDRLLPLTTAAREQTAVYVSNLADGLARFPEMSDRPSPSMAWAAIPAIVDGTVLGVFGVNFLREHEFSGEDRMFLQTLVDIAAAAIACRLGADEPAPVVDLRSVMVQVVSTFPAFAHRVRASSDGSPALAHVDGPNAMAAIDQLVSNAIRHSLPGGTVHVHCATVRGMVAITVDDEGQGVASDRRRSIFHPSADGSRGGLARARDLARTDGGDLVCTSSPSHGARFTLTYPAADA